MNTIECVAPWSEQSGSVISTFSAPEWFAEKLQVPTPQVTPQVTGEVTRLLPLCVTPVSRKELQEELGLKDIEHFRKVYLLPASLHPSRKYLT